MPCFRPYLGVGLKQGVFLQGVVSRVVMRERHASGFRVVMKGGGCGVGDEPGVRRGMVERGFSDWWGCTRGVASFV